MKPTTKIVLAIVILLSLAYGAISLLSSGDGLPNDGAPLEVEVAAPAPFE